MKDKKNMKLILWSVKILSTLLTLIGIAAIVTLSLGYRPILDVTVIPDWDAINVIATIVLGVIALFVSLQIASIEYRTQKHQTRLAIFELRYTIYENLYDLFIFAECIQDDDFLNNAHTINYVEDFDKFYKSHDIACNSLSKANLLFPVETSSLITIVGSASTILFINLQNLYINNSNNEVEIINEIQSSLSRILKHKEQILDNLEHCISLEMV